MGDMAVESVVAKGTVVKKDEAKKQEKKVPAGVRTDYIRGGLEDIYQKREGGPTVFYGPFMISIFEKDIYRVDGPRTQQVHFPLNLAGVNFPIKFDEKGRFTATPYFLYGTTGVDATIRTNTKFGQTTTSLSSKSGDYGSVGIRLRYAVDDPNQTVITAMASTGKGTISVHQSPTKLGNTTVAPAADGIGEVYASEWQIGASQNIIGKPGKPGSVRAAITYGQKHDGVRWGTTSTSDARVNSLGLEWKASDDFTVSGKVNMTNFGVSGLTGPQSHNNIDFGFGASVKF